jgi:hypothetical protein
LPSDRPPSVAYLTLKVYRLKDGGIKPGARNLNLFLHKSQDYISQTDVKDIDQSDVYTRFISIQNAINNCFLYFWSKFTALNILWELN